jgi:hypothetical protein
MKLGRVLTVTVALSGALLLSRSAGAAEWRVPGYFPIAHNDVRGRVRVAADDCGGYDAPGIVLFADWRDGADGAKITGNRVTENRVSLSSTRPALVSVSGVELSDTRNLAAELDLTDNAIVYNGLRGLAVPVALTPEELSTVNRIEKNLTGPRHHDWPGRALDALAPGAGAASPSR